MEGMARSNRSAVAHNSEKFYIKHITLIGWTDRLLFHTLSLFHFESYSVDTWTSVVGVGVEKESDKFKKLNRSFIFDFESLTQLDEPFLVV